MLDRLLPHLDARVIPEGEHLQADELFAKLFAETLAHAAEQLHRHYPIILVGIVMGHFDDMLEDKIPPVFIVALVSKAA